MNLKKIKLQNFRNFKKKEIEFGENVTVIYGPNASGKTNILEAVNMLATGKSFKARVQEEVINYNADISRISGEVSSIKYQVSSINPEDVESFSHNTKYNIHNTSLQTVLTRGEIEITEDSKQKAPRKRLLVNGVPKRLTDFAGNLKTVLFGPWDMDLVTESPSVRRNFLDNVLSTVDGEYRRASLSYEKGLRQRNRLLFRIREEGLSRSQLLFWNQLLIKTGNYMTEKRGEFIEFVNSTRDFPATEIITKAYGGKNLDFNLTYDKSVISEGRLNQYKEEEVAAATTLVGPHRDDFVFQIKGKEGVEDRSHRFGGSMTRRDLASFGSRGEQRMGVLWLKMAELKFVEEATGEKPVLLLDDIYSELDHEHRDIVMQFISSGKNKKGGGKMGQVIITTADEHFLEGFSKKIVSLVRL